MENKTLRVNVNGGYICATVSEDPDYPGIAVEFVADDDHGQYASRFKVQMEQPTGENVRALAWTDRNSEDYTEEFELEDEVPKIYESADSAFDKEAELIALF